MDVLRIIMIIVASYVALAGPAAAVTPDTEPPDTVSEEITTETEAPTTSPLPPTTPPPPRNCSTAREEAGVCVPRRACDYSTGPIDHSLYKPSWYTSSCLDDEVCCPFHALNQDIWKNEENSDDVFDDDNF